MSIGGHVINPNPFSGAKLLLFMGSRLVVMLRDDKPDIPFPAHWDFPGGARDGDEKPAECVLRETREEVGLSLSLSDLRWSREFHGTNQNTWLFAAHLEANLIDRLVLGHEGQELRLMVTHDYIAHPRNVPHLAARLQQYLVENPLTT